MNRKKDIFELVIYGLFSAMFGFAFFFGLMYPQYGLSAGTYCVEDESTLEYEQMDDQGVKDRDCGAGIKKDEKLTEISQKEFDLVKIKKISRENIVYRSYVWECLKNI